VLANFAQPPLALAEQEGENGGRVDSGGRLTGAHEYLYGPGG
jgi:hypothetical protein